MKTLEVKSRSAWRRWLQTHHSREREIWLVFYKVGSPKRTFVYAEALDEALCWGWIDSLIKRLDDERYAQKFTPRADPRKWSPTNVAKMRELLAAGVVQPAGLAAVAPEVLQRIQDGQPVAKRPPPQMPAELGALLTEDAKADAFFRSLPPSAQRLFLGWVGQAKRPETREKRSKEAVALLAQGKRLAGK
ncbi:MAG: YdeI/OmpD-associated family protein [Myxococcales bacterium]